MAQAEQRVELLLELDRARAAAQRADRHRAPGRRLARDLEHRKGDVQATAQVDVRVVVLVHLVAGRAQLADQAVLEHERAELRARRAVVDDRRMVSPDLGRRGRREVRARAGAQRDRLADIEHLAGGVAEDVDAGRVRQRRRVGLVALDRRARERAARARACAAHRAEHRERVGDRRRVRAQAAEQRAEHPRARLGVRERAVRRLDLDTERVGERGQPALAHERREAARERDRAQPRRIGPRQLGALEGLAQHALVEGGVVGDEHASFELLGEVGQDRVGRRRGVDHRLRDLREALDRARQRRAAVDERLPAIVQLAAADEHGADLGQLARRARLAVGLGVDDEELGGRERLGEQVHERMFPRSGDALQAELQRSPHGAALGRPDAGVAFASWCQSAIRGVT